MFQILLKQYSKSTSKTYNLEIKIKTIILMKHKDKINKYEIFLFFMNFNFINVINNLFINISCLYINLNSNINHALKSFISLFFSLY